MATNTEKVIVQVIVKGSSQLDKLDKKTGKATKSVGGLNKSMTKMAAGVFAAATAFRMIGAVIGSAIKTFTSFEFQMAKVRAVSGATDTEFKQLSQTAQDLGRTTFFTATQVAELQTNYAKLGFTTSEILKAQEATLLLATATGTDLARASLVAGAAVRGFGLDASETGRVVDVMTLAFNSSALDIEKWQTSMTKVAPIAASMNIEIEDTAAIMGTLTDAGIEASIAGTSMRNIFLKMKDSSSDLSRFLGFTVHSSEDLTKALAKLSTASSTTLDSLVNIRQVAAFNVMVKGSERIKQLTADLEEADGAAKKAASIIGDTLEGSFKRLKSASEGLAIELVDRLGGGLQGLIDKFANWINKLTENSDTIISVITHIKNAVKWFALYKIGVMAATLATNLYTKSLRISKAAMIKSGVGALVVGLGYLAEKFIFAKEKMDDFTDSSSDYQDALEKSAAAQERINEAVGGSLPETLAEVPAALAETNKHILDSQNVMMEKYAQHNQRYGNLTKKTLDNEKQSYRDLYFKRTKLLEKQGTTSTNLILDLEKRKLRILKKEGDIRQEIVEKQYRDDLSVQEEANNNYKINEKNKYLANQISKEQLTKNLEQQEIAHLKAMKVIYAKYGEQTSEIEDKILNKKIKAHESGLISFEDAQKSTKKIRDAALLEENKRNLLFIQDDTKTKEELEKNAKTHSDKIIEIETTSFNSQIANADTHKVDKIEIEQAFVDFQLENIQIIADAQLESDEETLQKTKEISEQKLSVMKAASDAIFTIMSGNLDKQTERETKKLEEQKDSGLITAEEYEVGVEAIQREAFEKKKRMDIAQAIINGALAMTTVMGQAGLLAFAFSPFIAAMTALQIGVIASQKFAQGGMIEEFANGGMVKGKSHAQGGEKFAVGGRVVELEGGEAVINKRSTSMFSKQLSAMNAAGGGVKFADGGLLNQPSFSQQQFNAAGQNQMMGAMGNSGKVVVVEADITDSQNTVSVIQAQATI